MKIRIDFVTNSSSSSFIGVFARIEDKNKADKIIAKYGLAKDIKSGKEILEEMNGYFYGYGADWAGVYLTPPKGKIKEDAQYIIWESYGGAGDDDSYFYGDYDEPDYDVDLDDFRDSEQEIYYDINEDNGFTDISSGYGAGRNG